MNPWVFGIGYLLSGLVTASVFHHVGADDGDEFIAVVMIPIWPFVIGFGLLVVVFNAARWLVVLDWPAAARSLWQRRTRRRSVTTTPPCQYCGAPRITGTTIRTCSTSCFVGVDPRLADHLDLPPWALNPTRGDPR